MARNGVIVFIQIFCVLAIQDMKMNDKVAIQERLKEIAAEMNTLLEVPEDQRSDDYETQYDALEKEADELTAELEKIREEEVKVERQKKADQIRTYAKQGNRVTTSGQAGTKIGRIRQAVEDDPKRGFRSLAHFAARIIDAGQAPRNDEMLMQCAAGTGLQQSVTSDGGVFVPPAFSRSIWDGVMQRSNSMLSYCDQITFDSANDSLTVPAKNETSRANGSRQGGIQGFWKSELAQMQSSKMTFREVKLTPNELYVFAYISDKLMRNAPVLASQLLESGSADEIAFKIGDAVINGNGTGMPKGVIGHPATISVPKENGQAAATIVYENIVKMYSRMHPNARTGAVWFVNPDTEVALQTLRLEIGTGGVPVYLPPGGLASTPYATLLGKPVIPIEYCSTLGTAGDVIFANLRYYAAAIKGTAQSAYSMHLKFDFAQTAFRVIFEMDGQPWLDNAITPYKGNNTLSPIVTLAARS